MRNERDFKDATHLVGYMEICIDEKVKLTTGYACYNGSAFIVADMELNTVITFDTEDFIINYLECTGAERALFIDNYISIKNELVVR